MSADPMRELHSLSTLVIQVLDAQKKYFKTREKDDLIASKQLEKRLRDRAASYLEVEQL